jgi:hypothetical protein
MQPNQAATELTEDQVLTFLVNTLNKDIWDVLVGHRADEDSVTHLCDVSEESPHGNRYCPDKRLAIGKLQ